MNICTVVVAWNQPDLTLDCLASLVADGVAPEQIWLVDNGSARSCWRASARASRRCAQFGSSRIAASLAATTRGSPPRWRPAPRRCFCSTTTRWLSQARWGGRLAGALERDPRLGAVAPKVYYAIEGPRAPVGRAERRPRQRAGAHAWQQPARHRPARRAGRARGAVRGRAMLIRREAWQAAGPFWSRSSTMPRKPTGACARARAAGGRATSRPQPCATAPAAAWAGTRR